MDRLMALQAFARVVELGGFTKASDSLQMSKTTVSDLVQSLVGGGDRLRGAHRRAEGLEPGRTTSRYDVHRLLCEPCVFEGVWNSAPA